MLEIYKKYLLPAIIFQITILAGGYGTGQEFVQFFLVHGPIDGLLGLGVAALCWSGICMLSFSAAVRWKTYEYKSFFQNLLGKRWYLFEYSYLLLLFVVLAVVAASVGNLGEIMLGTAYNFNIGFMIVFLGIFLYLGSKYIEHSFSIMSFAIVVVYAIFSLLCLVYFKNDIISQLQRPVLTNNWFLAGVQYAGYNLGLIPAVFFVLRYLSTRREALISGFLAGIWAIFPGVLFYLAMLGRYNEVQQVAIPSVYLLDILNMPIFRIVFSIILFTTLSQTAISLLHAFNERLATSFAEHGIEFTAIRRSILGILMLLGSMLVAQIGLQALIKYGYGILTWLIIFVYIIPLLFKSMTNAVQRFHT